VLIGSAFALMILDLFVSNRNKIVTHLFSLAALAVVLFMLATGVGGQGEVFHGMFVRDTAADVMKTGIVLLSGLTLVYGWRYLRDRKLFQGEIPVLMLFGTAGMMMLVSAGSLLMVYLGLELLALCSYALVASNRDNGLAGSGDEVHRARRAGLGPAAVRHVDDLRCDRHAAPGRHPCRHPALGRARAADHRCGVHDRRRRLQAGRRAVPHVAARRLPGRADPVALFISSAPKLAAFGMAYRLLEMGVGPLSTELQLLIAGLAVLSLAIGNLMAIAQTNLKRMLAFSTVSHIGFLLLGFAGDGGRAMRPRCSTHWPTPSCPRSRSARSSRCRAPASRPRRSTTSRASTRNPWMAGLVMCIMASLAGVPPFWASGQAGGAGRGRQRGLLWLAIVGVCARGRLLLLPARHQGHVLR
jgi:NADH-quinone oxidoreductase subunit N